MRSNDDSSGTLILLTAVALLVVAGGAAFFYLGTSMTPVAAPIARAAPVPVTAPLDEVDLGEPVLEALKVPIESAPASQRAAVTDSLDGRRWSDLLVAVDALTGAPIEGACVWHFAANGERARTPLDALVRRGDLDEGCLAALDGDLHCPRFFVPNELSHDAGTPRAVSLYPAGALALRLADGAPAQPWPVAVAIRELERFDNSIAVDAHLAEQGITDPAEVEALYNVCKLLRQFQGESSDARFLMRQARWLLRTESVRTMLTLAGPPTVGGFAKFTVEALVTYPHRVDDLPVGVLLAVSIANVDGSDALVALGASGSEPPIAWSRWLNLQHVVERGATQDVYVHLASGASLRGAIAADAEDGHVRILRRTGENKFTGEVDDAIAPDGAFRYGDFVAGHRLVEVSWTEPDGALARELRHVDLAAGEDHDLGLITLARDSRTITIVPKLVVDGEPDPTFLSGALDECAWRLFVGQKGGAGKGLDPFGRHTQRTGFAPFVIASLGTGDYWCAVNALDLPTDVGERLRAVKWQDPHWADLSEGDQTIELVFELVSSSEVTVTATVPAAAARELQAVSGKAYEVESGASFSFQFTDNWQLGRTEPRQATASVALPSGRWVVVVVATSEYMDFGGGDEQPAVEPPAWVGRAELSVASGIPAAIDVMLGAAACATGDAAFFTGSADAAPFTMVAPSSMPEAMADLWSGSGSDGGPIVVRGLFPNTEYKVYGREQRFSSGPAGTTVRLGD